MPDGDAANSAEVGDADGKAAGALRKRCLTEEDPSAVDRKKARNLQPPHLNDQCWKRVVIRV
jgi:hypothetical protein